MSAEEYVHPDSGRRYREGDPAHRFAQLAAELNRLSEEFTHHYKQRLAGKDYLAQSVEWRSDPSRIAGSMHRVIEALNETDIAISKDWYATAVDDEWRRKYGTVVR
jgi:hypothetical protein